MVENIKKIILVIHGPNLNLIGIQSSKNKTQITLDKINYALRIKARKLNIKLKFIQTHDEAKAVTFLHRNRNKCIGVLIAPMSWHTGGFVISDSLHFLELPYRSVSIENHVHSLFYLKNNVYNKNPISAYVSALELLNKDLKL